MSEREAKVSVAEPPAESNRGPRPAGDAAQSAGGGSTLFALYKPGQGTYVRWGTAIGVGAIAVFGAAFVGEQMRLFTQGMSEQVEFIVKTLVPVALIAVAAYFIFWGVGQNHRVVEFMIATEGEMKKVNWSTRREIWGATRVVIFTVFALAIILAVVDFLFIVFFSGIGVLRMHILERLFGAGQSLS